jgi:hypothetical protein
MRRIILLTAALLMSTLAFSQHDRAKMKERIEAQKVGFITQSLDLSSRKAKAFWPVYNKQQEERDILREKKHQLIKTIHEGLDKRKEAETEKLMQQLFVLESKELEQRRKHYSQLKEVISVQQIALLHKAERDFKRELLEKFKDKKQHKRR